MGTWVATWSVLVLVAATMLPRLLAAAAGTPTAAGGPIATDTFAGRTVASGWGTASDGQAWSVLGGSAPLSVSGNEGLMGTGSSTFVRLGTTSATEEEVVLHFTSSSPNADDGRAVLRFQDGGTFYAAGIASPSNKSELDIFSFRSGTRTSLASQSLAVAANTPFWERARVVTQGTSAVLSVKAWADGTTEPSGWQLTATDNAPIPSGGVGIDGYAGGAGWRVDTFSAGDLSSPTPSPSTTPSITPTPSPSPSSSSPPPPPPTPVSSTSTVIPGFMIQDSNTASGGGAAISTPGYSTSGWYPASARSTVYAALTADGVEKDPFFSTNMQSPVGNFSIPWWYRSDFVLDSSTGLNTFLDVSGVISAADVWVNGTQVATTSQVAGAYTDHDLNITSFVHPGTNTVAFEVQPNDPNSDFTLSWIDWNPYPPDNNMGIFRDVAIRRSGPVALRGAHVLTSLSSDLSQAQLTVKVDARNDSPSPVNATVTGTIGSIVFSQSVSLAANSTQTLSFAPASYPQLTIANPQVWWPAGMGGQPLYALGMSATLSGVLSDDTAETFGIRTLSEPVTNGIRHIIVNGRPVEIRGAGWAPDIFLHTDLNVLDGKFRYMVDMGINGIRQEGHLEVPEFYADADRYGILVFPGWECCSKWQKSPYSGTDQQTDINSMTSEAQDLRDHPSVALFFVGSDQWPATSTLTDYLNALNAADWPDPVVGSVQDFSAPDSRIGPTGFREPGPYQWVPPVYFYTKMSNTGGAMGFDSETSAGPDIPTLDSLNRMLTPTEQQSLLNPAAPQYHAGTQGGEGYNENLQTFDNALTGRYGSQTSVADFDRKAQLANYEATRAQYEAYGRNFTDASGPSTGFIYWQLTSAFSSLYWSLFDHYLDTGGAYYGTKEANKALHVSYSYDNGTVAVINRNHAAATGLTVRVDVSNLDGTTKFTTTTAVPSVPGDGGNVRLSLIPSSITGLSTTYLVRLILTDASAATVDRNVYWLSSGSQDALDYSSTTFCCTNASSYANLTGLQSMAQTSVTATATSAAGSDGTTTVTLNLRNNSNLAVPAFFIDAHVVDGSGAPILPASWSDNEVSLWPGESLILTATYKTSELPGGNPNVRVSGWNIGTQTISTVPPTPTPPSFVNASPPTTAVAGQPYSYTFSANGNPAPTFTVTSGSLPTGLTLTATTGVLSGTPSVTGTFTFTVQASNGFNPPASTGPLSITVNSKPAFIADSPPLSATQGSPYGPYTFTASGSPAPTFSFTGSLPAGLSLSSSGVLSGTPSVTGTFTFNAVATNAAGSANGQSHTLTVAPSPTPPSFVNASPPTTALTGQPYSYTFTASGNPAPTFTVVSGSLPTGLTLAATTGLLSGTPSVTGTFSFTVQASNGVSPPASTGTLSIAVTAPPPNDFSISANPTSLSLVQNTSDNSTISTSVTSGSAQTVSLSITGVPSGANASFSPGSVTAGNSSTLTVGAGNTATGTYSLTITGTGPSATHSTSLTLTITAPPPPPPFPIAGGSLLAQDTFAGRTVTGGWGTATDRHVWALRAGSASVQSVSGGEGRVSGAGSMSTVRTTLGPAASDMEVVDRYTSGDFANDDGHVLLRFATGGGYYAVGLDSPTNGPEINVMRSANGSSKNRVARVAFAAVNGTAYWQRAQIATSGSSATIRVRVWADGTTEPSTWNLTYADTSPLAAGAAGVEAWDGGAGWAIDHFSAGNLAAPPTPTAPAFVNTTPPSTAVVGQAYSYTFTATGNPAPTFTVSSGSLPTGLSLAAATGVLSGTPSVTGTFTFVVQASNGVSPAASTPTLSIAVSAPVPNNFSISANPTSLSLVQNTSGTSTISTSVTSGSAQSVSFSIVGVPSGANASFSPGSVTAGSSSTLAVGAGNAVTGTYSLTITGTGSSATHSTSLTLTIMAPPPPPPFPIAAGTIFAQDTFAGRTVAGGWGTASDGNIWTLTGGSGSSESVSGNQGHVLGSGSMSTLVATLGTSTAADTEVVDRLTSNDYANDAGQVIFRASSSSTYYAAGLDSPVSGAEINVFRVSGATKSRVANVAFAATNGTAYWQRARITTSGGSVTIMVRVWQDGTVEPSTWNLAYTDNSPLPAGMAGARSWDGGLGWAIDHFSAGKLS